MKKLFAFLGILVAITVTAQQIRSWNATTLRAGGTNNIFGVGTITECSNSVWTVGYIDVPRSENVSLLIKFKFTGGTTNSAGVLFPLYRAYSAGNICSNSPLSFVIYPNATGAATNYFTTNIALLGLQGLWMGNIGNSNMYAMTNISIEYGFKN